MEKRLLIEKIQESLIVCDNEKCDYEIPYTEEQAKYTYLYIDFPCPKCGENLLTLEDYKQHQAMMRTINWLNKWFSWIMYLIPKKTWENRKTVSCHVHNGINWNDETKKDELLTPKTK